MPIHTPRPESFLYSGYGRYQMSESEFNARAYQDGQPNTKTNLARMRPHILKRVWSVLVENRSAADVASECNVTRQAIYLNIHKFFVETGRGKS